MKYIFFYFILIMMIGACGNQHMPLASHTMSDKNTDSNKQETETSPTDPTEEVLGFSEVYQSIIQARCSICHTGAAAPKGLDMSSEQVAFNNLVNTPSQDRPGTFRVSPGEALPKRSYLLAKVVESGGDRKPPRMPLGGPFLSDEEIELIVKWIEQGANR